MGDPARSELSRFLGPRPGWTYVYGMLDDGTREPGTSMVVSGLAEDDAGTLLVREACSIPWRASRTGTIEGANEYRVRIEGNDLVQAWPAGDYVLLRAPLRVDTTWTRPVTGYSAEAGPWRRELHCRIALIESLPVFGENRLTVRVVGGATIPGSEVVLIEQHAAGIGLVLRRQQMGDFDPSEIVLEEIRPSAPAGSRG